MCDAFVFSHTLGVGGKNYAISSMIFLKLNLVGL